MKIDLFRSTAMAAAIAAAVTGSSACVAADASPSPAATAEVVDLGSALPTPKAVNEGLFPDDACKELEANGFKCMGFKPPVRYSLPASTFSLGSAELPSTLKRQLDVFAQVLSSKRGADHAVRIVGHADATGSETGNVALSVRRAEAVKEYLMAQGAPETLLSTEGVGATQPKDSARPKAPENRRVEIGRQP